MDREKNKLRLCEVTNSCENIDILHEISGQILSCYDLKKITHALYESINKLVDAPFFALAQYNESEQCLDFWGIQSSEEPLRTGKLNIDHTDSWSVYCFVEQKELIFNSQPNNSSKHFSKLLFDAEDKTRLSFVYLPLVSKHKCIGIITVQSFQENAYDPKQIKLLKSLSNYIAFAVENANAFNKIKQQNAEIKEKTNQLEATISNISEIVNLRTAEIEKKNQELERLSIVAKETNNAIMLMDASGNILWLNDCFTRLYGYTLSEFIAARGSNIRSTSFAPDIDAILTKCIETKEPCGYQARNIRLDGTSIWTQTTLTPILNDAGEIRNITTIDSDISEIMEAERIIKEKTIDINNSIQYAGEIQRAIMSSKAIIKESFSDVFIIYKPLSKVSGDFYWHHSDENWTWIVAADCTGHGVPAALMSILGISILNEIGKHNDVFDAAEVLNRLRSNIKGILHEHGENKFIYDGMDMTISRISKDKTKLEFAGAYNSMLFIRNNTLTQIKGDRMPIGDHVHDQTPFTLQTIDILPGDKFYMFSDGYASQFGGPNNKKFMQKKFIDLIAKNQDKEMYEQKRILLNELHLWMKQGNTVQTDDIIVIGFEI